MGEIDPLSKTLSEIAVDSAADARKGLAYVFGEAASEFGGMLGDTMRFYRFKNMIGILGKMRVIIEARGIPAGEVKALPFGDALRSIEAASYEENEDVQDLWARLLANATTADAGAGIKKLHVDLLKSIGSSEAHLLNLLHMFQSRYFRSQDEVRAFSEEMNAAASNGWRQFSEEERRSAVLNLVRLRCITFRPRQFNPTRMFAELPREMSFSHFDKWCAIDPKKFEELLVEISDLILATGGAKDYAPMESIPLGRPGIFSQSFYLKVPEMNHLLTPLGSDLMQACRLDEPAAV